MRLQKPFLQQQPRFSQTSPTVTGERTLTYPTELVLQVHKDKPLELPLASEAWNLRTFLLCCWISIERIYFRSAKLVFFLFFVCFLNFVSMLGLVEKGRVASHLVFPHYWSFPPLLKLDLEDKRPDSLFFFKCLYICITETPFLSCIVSCCFSLHLAYSLLIC